jgi:hypothetical protein
MADIGQMWLPAYFGHNTAYNYALDAANKQVGFVFHAPANGPVLTKAAIRCGALTGASPTYVVSMQGISAAGYPDGTIKGGGSPVSVEITPAVGDAGKVIECTFANSYDSASGEALSMVIAPKAGITVDGSNNWSFTMAITSINAQQLMFPASAYHNGTAWARSLHTACYGVSDGSAWYGGWPIQATGSYNTAASPNYIGNKITLPSGMTTTISCVGFWVYHQFTGSGHTFRASLYDSGNTLLAQTDFSSELAQKNGRGAFIWDDGPIDLSAGDTYRIVFTSTDSTIYMWYDLYTSADHKTDGMPLLTNISATEGTTAAWTDYANRIYECGLVIDAMTASASGGFTGQHQLLGLGR